MEPETIHSDVEVTSTPAARALDPEQMFLQRLRGDNPSTPKPEDLKASEETQEQDSDANEHDDEPETDEQEATPPRRAADDDDEVVVKVGDSEHKVSVKDLKRLFGQEQALTRKGQETAALQQQVQEQATTYRAGLDKITEAAKARWAEYEKIDFLAAKDSMSPEAFSQLRQDATKAYQDFKFFSEELSGLTQRQQAEHAQAMREAAKNCVQALTRPPTDEAPNPAYIEGWNDTVYNDIRSFALSAGGDPKVIDSIVDPVAIKIIHMAMLYQRAQEKAKTIKAKPTVPVTTRKVPAQAERGDGSQDQTETERRALRRLQATGSIDDAQAAFLARLRRTR